MTRTMLADLDQRFPIVDPVTGKASDYLMMLLQNNNLSNKSTDELLQELLAREIIAGDGLTGGGALEGPGNITLDADEQEILDAISTTQGSILFRGAADWQALGPGTSGQFLKTLGAAADPQWATASGGTAWSLVNQSGAIITSGHTWDFATHGAVANFSVINLAGYSDIRISMSAVSTSSSGFRFVRVSTNNGSSFYSAAGDYVNGAGTVTGGTFDFVPSATTAARTAVMQLDAVNVTGIPKRCVGDARANGIMCFVGSTSPINAIQIASSAGNLNGGFFDVFVR